MYLCMHVSLSTRICFVDTRHNMWYFLVVLFSIFLLPQKKNKTKKIMKVKG